MKKTDILPLKNEQPWLLAASNPTIVKPEPACPQTGDSKAEKNEHTAETKDGCKESRQAVITTAPAEKIKRTQIDEPLKEDEKKDLEKLEKVVAEGENKGLESAVALAQIHDKRLYRETHTTFQAYCEERLGFQRSHGNRLMNAGKAYAAIKNLQMKDKTIRLPTSESQLRALSGMAEEMIQNAWKKSVTKAGDTKPTGAIVEEIVKELKGQKTGKKTAHKMKLDMKALKNAFLKLYAVIKKNEQEDELQLAEELKRLMQIEDENGGANEDQNGTEAVNAVENT